VGKHKLKGQISVKASVRIEAYEVICRAIETGIAFGWNRAHKHGKPTEEVFKQAMYDAITNELWEVLKTE